MTNILKRTWAEVSLENIKHNMTQIRSVLKPTTVMMAIVKADAYGHGAPVVAKYIQNETDAGYFGVSNIDEAIQLRKIGITKPILILGYTPREFTKELIENEITQTVFSLDYAHELSEEVIRLGGKLKIHIKIDTGMSRLGFVYHSLNGCGHALEEIQEVCRLGGFDAEGVFTHFAVSDDLTSDYTEKQFECFTAALDKLSEMGISFRLRHCANSAAVINYPEMQLDMVRPGIIIYGLYPAEKMARNINLKPAMELKTVISQVKELEEDTTVSYGRVYKTDKNTVTATLPVGYADGFLRVLSNNAEVLINGTRANVIGRVCMDQCIVDATGIPDVKNGQTVTIFGRDKDEYISVDELAGKMETINYEVTCLIGKRVPRLYFDSGRQVDYLNYIL